MSDGRDSMGFTRKAVPIGALVLASALGACATTASGSGYSPDAETVVQVSNRNASRIVVSVVSLGMTRRLGEVETNGSGSFTLPTGINLADLQILLDPVGPSGSFLTPRMVAHRGDVIVITIPANLAATQYRLM